MVIKDQEGKRVRVSADPEGPEGKVPIEPMVSPDPDLAVLFAHAAFPGQDLVMLELLNPRTGETEYMVVPAEAYILTV